MTETPHEALPPPTLTDLLDELQGRGLLETTDVEALAKALTAAGVLLPTHPLESRLIGQLAGMVCAADDFNAGCVLVFAEAETAGSEVLVLYAHGANARSLKTLIESSEEAEESSTERSQAGASGPRALEC